MGENTIRSHSFYGLRSFAEIDDKIKQHARYWKHVKLVHVEYFGGAYQIAVEVKGEINEKDKQA